MPRNELAVTSPPMLPAKSPTTAMQTIIIVVAMTRAARRETGIRFDRMRLGASDLFCTTIVPISAAMDAPAKPPARSLKPAAQARAPPRRQ